MIIDNRGVKLLKCEKCCGHIGMQKMGENHDGHAERHAGPHDSGRCLSLDASEIPAYMGEVFIKPHDY